MSSSSMEPLIQSLLNPEIWPHHVTEVELLETHISWILLAGEFAYKLKKPVDFGFVDFTTLQRRRLFCEEELRLNRRLAPDHYLEVVPIAGDANHPLPGGDGTPIEYAVKMRRFRQEQLLSRLIARGALTPQHIDCLAEEVARFHAQIEVADAGASIFGTPESVFAPVQENFRHLQSLHDHHLASQIDTLRDWSNSKFAAHRHDFTQRLQNGFVRNCHGDMHLGNMFLEAAPQTNGPEAGDRVIIFDCIEFNEGFRWIDVMSEAAFAVMDLADRGRSDFAWRFLDGYLERTGDYAGLSVIRFYLVYRALVRAKVASLRANQGDVSDDELAEIERELQQYVDLAVSYTRPRPTPLMITHGFSGSGKTTGMQSVVEQLGAIRIRSDVERQRLFAGERTDSSAGDRKPEIYTPEHTAQTYDRLAELAGSTLAAGFPVVVDATFLKRSRRDQFRELARRLNVAFVIVDFDAPETELRARIVLRQQAGIDASEADLQVLDGQLSTHDPIAADERPFVVTVESNGSKSVDLPNVIMQAIA